MPEPYLRETTRNNKVYSIGELELVARILAAHEQEFVNYSTQHRHVIETMHQHISAYRAQHI